MKISYVRRRAMAPVVFLAGLLGHPLVLDAQRVAAVGVDVDNDVFTTFDLLASDYEYSHGILLWVELAGSSATLRSLDSLLMPECSGRHSECVTRLALGQEMYTPRLESEADPLPGQRAHAGWVHASVSRIGRTPAVESELRLQVGVIGPPAKLEQTQKLIHRLFKMRTPYGWQNQLATQPTVQLRVQRSAVVASTSPSSFMSALGYSATSDVGTAVIQGSGGVTAALCYNRQCGSGEVGRAGAFSARVLAVAGPSVVLHNVLLEGGRRGPAPSVERRTLVWQGRVGATVRWRSLTAGYERVFRGKEYATEPEGFSYGTLRLALELPARDASR